ncbi:hypothetical protein HBI71_004790 [Parastagonospora nodorum]|nr:hypothetical protein HBI71_004790 [Parastagonospora nodorum]KAH5414350.1 hypothetical protein HBI47_153410 [Parastagonospora nodorum]KAH6051388.1 hypothetical protein HBI54_037080 [Parastagonospora nodorum]
MEALNSKRPVKLTANVESLSIVQSNQTNFPLLRLPAELRNLIYTFTLDLDIGVHHNASYKERDPLDFARTSHQIYVETAQTYFDTKILPFLRHDSITLPDDDIETMNGILAKLTPLQKTMITHFHFGSCELFNDLSNIELVCPLLELPNLREITYCKPKIKWNALYHINTAFHRRWRHWMRNEGLRMDICELERPSLELV